MNMLAKRTWDEELRHDVAHQVSDLKRQVEALAQAVGHAGTGLQRDAGDVGEAIWHTGADIAHEIGRQSKRAVRAVQKDPTPALVTFAALIAVGAVIGLMLSRR